MKERRSTAVISTAFFPYSPEDISPRKKLPGSIGFNTLLPLLLEGRAWVNHRASVRFSLERELPLTTRLSLTGEVRYDTLEAWEWSPGPAGGFPAGFPWKPGTIPNTGSGRGFIGNIDGHPAGQDPSGLAWFLP